jgi:ornithine carrier protein
MVENASLFMSYGELQNLIRYISHRTPQEKLPLYHLSLAAAGAGAITSFLLCVLILIINFAKVFLMYFICRTPIELIKCKMQVQMLVVPPVGAAEALVLGSGVPRKLPGPISLLMSVIRNSGLRGLWLGHTGTFIRETGGTAAWLGTKEYVASLLLARRSHRNSTTDTQQLRAWESAFSGACGGAAFNLALFPADTVKSAMQTEEELRPKATTVRGLDSSIPRKATFGGTFMALYRAQGIRGLYAGCGITVARSIPSSAIIFLIYDGLKKCFG